MRFSRPDDGIMRLEESFRFCARYIAGIIQDPGCFIFRLALGAPLVVVPHPRGSFPIGLSALLSAPAAFASCFALAASCHRESTPTRANSATPRLTSPAVHTIPPCTLVSADFLYIGRTDKKNTELWGKTDYFRFFFFFVVGFERKCQLGWWRFRGRITYSGAKRTSVRLAPLCCRICIGNCSLKKKLYLCCLETRNMLSLIVRLMNWTLIFSCIIKRQCTLS